MVHHFWIVTTEGVFIERAHSRIDARMRASLAALARDFIEAHELPASFIKKVPKRAVGRLLSTAEAQKLLGADVTALTSQSVVPCKHCRSSRWVPHTHARSLRGPWI